MTELDFKQIEQKWQKKWEDSKIFQVKEDFKKKKFYVLEMFPYPSGAGLHMGHALNYTIGDIYARFKRMNGFNVLYPMGYDAFGLPAENAAIKAGIHPKKYTEESMKNFIKQQKALGLSYDWSRKVVTCYPEYYKWNQYFFLKFFEKGLVYRKKSAVNWCPKCNTVLANEQVIGGKCWRHEDTDIEIKHLEQWFIKTTNYSEELLKEIPNLNWPERIKSMQENWIGKSYGTEILFEINGEKWPIFTTRPDTIYGVTFMVISAQHPRLMELVTKEQKKEVEAFLKKLKSVSEKELEEMEKEGVFTGSYAINPVTKEKIPVYAGNFVVADYGCGMVMAVPTHDQRDFEFAKKYKIPMKIVIQPKDKQLIEPLKEAYTGDGILINSDKFNGMENRKAIDDITKYLESKKLGKRTINYKLRDWLISRQRYWGTPIPIVYCNKCGIVPVKEKDLPIELPEDVKFKEGNPLATNEEFLNTKCPKCKGKARRETDTMDTFFDSSWYFLRYCSNEENKSPFNKEKVEYWMPVDIYIGGAEHACMHLIYARFFTKALRDIGLLKFNEPFTKLFNQGILHAEGGQKMSKSLGNIVNPIDVIEKYSADSLRITLMSLASPDKDSVWNEKGLEGNYNFIKKMYEMFTSEHKSENSTRDKYVVSKMNSLIKNVTNQIEKMEYNDAIREIISFVNYIKKYSQYISDKVWKESIKNVSIIISPFTPHIAEEIWEKLGNKKFISLEKWPKFDGTKIRPEYEAEDNLISQVISDINEIKKLAKINKPTKISIFISEPWKYDVYNLVMQGKELKEIMQDEKLKKIGNFVAAYFQKLQKKKPLNELFLTAGSELESLRNSKESLERELECKIEILKAEEHNIPKAKSAEPGKPGIIVE